MTEEKKVLSLSKQRKERQRAEAKALADRNSVAFGRSKAERILDAARNAKARAKLDEHRLDEE